MILINLVLHVHSFMLMLIVLYGNYRIFKNERSTDRWFMILATLNIVMLFTESVFYYVLLNEWDVPVFLGVIQFIYYLAHFAFMCAFVFFQAGFVGNGEMVHFSFFPVAIIISAFSAFFGCFASVNNYIFPVIASDKNDILMIMGQMGNVCLFVLLICMILQYHRYMPRHVMIVLLSFQLLPILTFVLKCAIPALRLMPVGFCFSMIIINIFAMYNRNIWLGQKEAQVERSRMKIMLSQIRPHFIYNVLNTIYHLCDINVEMAKEAIDLFSGYLRRNFKSIEGDELISIKDELEHVRFYYLLEKMRFKDEMELIMDVEDVDFMIPQLSVEPLVENAIKHGILKRNEGGTVRLSVKEADDFYVITIEDDGVGFETEKLDRLDPTHVGIRNIRERLNYMGASLDIKSIAGNRTVCVIKVPKTKSM